MPYTNKYTTKPQMAGITYKSYYDEQLKRILMMTTDKNNVVMKESNDDIDQVMR